MNTKEFIEKSISIHGDRYDYLQVFYTNAKTKVCIICKVHGAFSQTPNNHTHSAHPRGCPSCAILDNVQSRKSSKQSILERLEGLFGSTYDYSKINYSNNSTPIELICSEHGSFYKTTKQLFRGMGCDKCSPNVKNERISKSKLSDISDLIQKANIIHNNKYDYSNVIFTRKDQPVAILCPHHGLFNQTLYKHINLKRGCLKCFLEGKTSSGETELFDFVCNHTKEPIFKNYVPTFFPNKQHLDIYIPSLKLAFEFNGNYWHSEEKGKDETYHQNKFNWCEQADVLLVHVWESQWHDEQSTIRELVKTIIKNKYTIDTIPDDIYSKVKEMVWLK